MGRRFFGDKSLLSSWPLCLCNTPKMGTKAPIPDRSEQIMARTAFNSRRHHLSSVPGTQHAQHAHQPCSVHHFEINQSSIYDNPNLILFHVIYSMGARTRPPFPLAIPIFFSLVLAHARLIFLSLCLVSALTCLLIRTTNMRRRRRHYGFVFGKLFHRVELMPST